MISPIVTGIAKELLEHRFLIEPAMNAMTMAMQSGINRIQGHKPEEKLTPKKFTENLLGLEFPSKKRKITPPAKPSEKHSGYNNQHLGYNSPYSRLF